MNQEVGSILGYFYQLFPCQIYEEEVPQDFEIPSMYFPQPFSFNSNDSLSTFMKTYNLNVKLFHENGKLAYEKAEHIADAVNTQRGLIPLINQDGTSTGEYLRISRIEARVTDNVAFITVNWDSRYFYNREVWPSLENVSFINKLKDEG
ncbi:phage portal protein [Metabacillus fastidiosus]|uniref:phage portal protein n=1 Tax=Metabacillus fastidiosus TaxID=1458 RepID=UPI003D2E35D7